MFEVNGVKFELVERKKIHFPEVLGEALKWNLCRQIDSVGMDTLESMCLQASRHNCPVEELLEICGYIARKSDHREIYGIGEQYDEFEGGYVKPSPEEVERLLLPMIESCVRIEHESLRAV